MDAIPAQMTNSAHLRSSTNKYVAFKAFVLVFGASKEIDKVIKQNNNKLYINIY